MKKARSLCSEPLLALSIEKAGTGRPTLTAEGLPVGRYSQSRQSSPCEFRLGAPHRGSQPFHDNLILGHDTVKKCDSLNPILVRQRGDCCAEPIDLCHECLPLFYQDQQLIPVLNNQDLRHLFHSLYQSPQRFYVLFRVGHITTPYTTRAHLALPAPSDRGPVFA